MPLPPAHWTRSEVDAHWTQGHFAMHEHLAFMKADRIAHLEIRQVAAEVHAMQRLRAQHGWSYAKIAPLFGVTTTTAYRAIVGQSWRRP